MHRLMNHYMGKFSSAALLREAPGEKSNAGGGSDGGSDGGDSNDGQQGNGDGGDDDDDGDLAGLLGDDGEVDDEDFDFLGTPGEYQQTPEEQAAAKALGEQIEAALGEYAVADSDIPDDFDPTDKASLKTLLSNTQRGAIQSTMKMMIPIINHALGTATKQMKHFVESSGAGKQKQSAAANEFKSLGLADSQQIAMAKPIFAQALKANGNDPKKAAKATRKAFAVMGISLAGGDGGSGGSRNQGGGGKSPKILTDGAALDDLFGKSK